MIVSSFLVGCFLRCSTFVPRRCANELFGTLAYGILLVQHVRADGFPLSCSHLSHHHLVRNWATRCSISAAFRPPSPPDSTDTLRQTRSSNAATRRGVGNNRR